MNTTCDSTVGPVVNSDDYTLADFVESEDPGLFSKAAAFTAFLDDWMSKGTYSYHRLATAINTNRTTIRDRETGRNHEMVVMSSNNYLGLNNHPAVMVTVPRSFFFASTGSRRDSRFFCLTTTRSYRCSADWTTR